MKARREKERMKEKRMKKERFREIESTFIGIGRCTKNSTCK